VKVSHFTIAVVFGIITLASSLKIAGTMGYYIAFTEDFVERLCENKDKPELNCDGKCELAKMLQQSQDNEVPIDLGFLKSETVLFLTTFFNVELLTPTFGPFVRLQYANSYCFLFSDRTTRPPQV